MKRSRRGSLARVALVVSMAPGGFGWSDLARGAEVFAVSGAPHVTSSSNDRDVAWQDFGFRVESAFVDAEYRAPTCVAKAVQSRVTMPNGSAACSAIGDGLSSFSSTFRRGFVTFKVPQADPRVPTLEFTVRKWDSTSVYNFGDYGQSARGTAADAVVTKSFGPFDAIFTYEAPLAGAPGAGRWRTVSSGLGWTAPFGLYVEVTGDRGRELDSGQRDRSVTTKVSFRDKLSGLRFAGWARRNFDDPAMPWRAGLTASLRF